MPNDTLNKRCKGFMKILYLLLPFVLILSSCRLAEGTINKNLKFNPVANKVYHFSLEKISVKSWTYQSIPVKIYDTVYLNFSLQNVYSSDSSVTCKLVWNRFVCKGKFKVNYIRDSLHALSTNVIMSDRGKVKYIQEMAEVVSDIKMDSNTPKNPGALIQDQIGNDATTDMLNRIFSAIPERDVKANKTWVSDITLITNHPVNISNYNVLKNFKGDTAVVEIQSNVFARPSPGDDPYIKGNQKGVAYMNSITGIPYWYSTQSEIVTTTSYYDVTQVEKITVRLGNSAGRTDLF